MDLRSLAQKLGLRLNNGQARAPCPICQPEHRKDQSALSITFAGGKLLLYCFKSGCSYIDIVQAINAPIGGVQIDQAAQRQSKRKQAEYAAHQLEKARSLWSASMPISGTKGEAYLRSRGITTTLPDSLRWMPDIYHAPTSSWCSAMVAKVYPIGGVHRTFFTKKGKRVVKNAKMMLGPCAGGAVPLSDASGPLVVCEGIETGLSLLSGLLYERATVLAALSTSGMKALKLPANASDLLIASDGDEPGRAAATSLASRAAATGWNVSMLPAPQGADWNDVLVDKKGVAK